MIRSALVGRSLKPFRRPRLWAGIWVLAIAVVVVVSLLPAPQLPNMPPGSDKFEHFLVYCALAIGAVQLYARRPAWVGAGIGLVLLGIGLEYAQGLLTTTRMMDRWDALANTLGVIAGLATFLTPWRDALLRFDSKR